MDDLLDMDRLIMTWGGKSRPRNLRPTKQKGRMPSLIFEGPIRWRKSPAVTDKQGRTIRWCWSTVRNEDREFIAWREVWSDKHGLGFRDNWRGRKSRWRVRHWALLQYNDSPYRTGRAYLPDRRGRL